MTLTKDDLEILRAPFAPHEHEFLNDNAYITEAAITTRLEDVDPAWTFDIISMNTRHTFGYDVQVTCIGRLTICGVSRDGVGQMKVMGKTFYYEGTGNNKKKVKLPEEDHSETNEAEKAAATDALKRAARLFGIGRYLLSLPDWVKDENSIERYLNGDGNSAQPKAQQQAKTQTQQKQAQPPVTPHKEGERMAVSLSSLTVRARKDDPKRNLLAFKIKNADIEVYAFSRDIFRDAGWIKKDEWGERKDYPIAQLIPATAQYVVTPKPDGSVSTYWEVAEVDFNPMRKDIAS